METIRSLRSEYEAAENKLLNLFPDKENFDDLLDKQLNEPYWLGEAPVAEVVAKSLHFLAKKMIELWCFCIMPNHVHLLFSLKDDKQDMFRIMQCHKSFTAKEANRILNLAGQFWEPESYDHVVREGEFENIVSYILNNPVKATFVKEWEEWKWNYLNPVLV